jgi:hypothetical protein
MDNSFWIIAAILFVTAVLVGFCGYIIGHVHGFVKGEDSVLERTNLKFDDLVYEYCPDCKRITREDAILDAQEVGNETRAF